MKVVRAALTFSLLIGLVVIALAGPFADLQDKVSHAKTHQEKLKILKNDPTIEDNEELAKLLHEASADVSGPQGRAALTSLCDSVEALGLAENDKAHPDAKKLVVEIKRSPFYNDAGEKTESNWLGRALATLKGWSWNPPEPKLNGPAFPNIGPFIIWGVWGLLGAALIAFLIYVLRRVDWTSIRKRKTASVLDEDEPDRTLDEWLILADQLEAQGKYREAVRGLYLACLLKIDEVRIAKFDRGQTNWEHLARIEASPKLPTGLDFRAPTQAFDRIWYGHQVRGAEDVAEFRAWYRMISESVRQVAA